MIMITATARDPTLMITGHAGFAEPGKDIVCAAVSALFLTLCDSLDEMTGDEYDAESVGGLGSIRWKNMTDKGRLLFEHTLNGFRMIADRYPDNVQMFIE